jgi:hypothetical protein
MKQMGKTHKEAIKKEFLRREEKKREELRLQKEKEDAKKKRKEERAAARERHKIAQLLEKIQATTIAQAEHIESYNPQIKIYDVRDQEGRKDGVYLIGGFVGELIITFTCVLDYILANPQNQSFQFTAETIEAFLKDLLVNENFADGICSLNLTRDPTIKEKPLPTQRSNKSQDISQDPEEEVERLDLDDETFAKFAMMRTNISDYGLSFFIDIMKDLVISKEFMEILYKVIVKIARTPRMDVVPVPEMPAGEDGAEPTEEQRSAAQAQIDQATAQNAEAERFNEELDKIQAKVKLNYRPATTETVECGLMRLNNYRQPLPEEGAAADALNTS